MGQGLPIHSMQSPPMSSSRGPFYHGSSIPIMSRNTPLRWCMVAALTLGVTAGASTSASGAERTLVPVKAGKAGDKYRVGSLKHVERAKLVGYPRRSVRPHRLRKVARAGLVGVTHKGRVVRAKRLDGKPSRASSRALVLKGRRLSASAPDTWITSGPARGSSTSSTSATFKFEKRNAVRVRYSLDGSKWQLTTSPKTVSGLSKGSHTFRVRAETRSGVVDPTPASRTWTVTGGAAAPSPTPAPAPTTPINTGLRPYDARSPWNTPIGANPAVSPNSARWMGSVADNNQPLTSDPDQYAIAVYQFGASAPRATVRINGSFSAYDNGDNSRVGGFGSQVTNVPIPAGATAGVGTDGQITFWNPDTGEEWAFWQFRRESDGSYSATNGWRYNTGAGNMGRFADGKAGRGAGTTYFAGLVRKWEIDQGRIDHALAFAYAYPSSGIVYPASKSDGGGSSTGDMPEGSRMQLDPSLTEADFNRWGLSQPAKVIARAMQTYGMYTIDNSGSSKIYLEDRKTAGWGSDINRDLTKNIPWSAFRVVQPPAAP
jgi:hypothetical protein